MYWKQDEAANSAEWDEDSSRLFMDYGRYFVPERELQIKTICDLMEPPREGPFHILELCSGEGLLAEALLKRFPEAIIHGFDGSDAMLAASARRLAHYGERFAPRPFNLHAREWRESEWPLQAIVSSLAVHHLDAEEKQQLYTDLYRMLAAPGVLVIADLIQPAHQAGVRVAAETWNEEVRRRALELDGTTDALDYFRREHWNYYEFPDSFDKPSPLSDHLKWLEQAGFRGVDAYWLKAGHALYGGHKA
jgi:trans-aconitate methyltransferase